MRPGMCRTRSGGRPSPQPAQGAWQLSRPSIFSRPQRPVSDLVYEFFNRRPICNCNTPNNHLAALLAFGGFLSTWVARWRRMRRWEGRVRTHARDSYGLGWGKVSPYPAEYPTRSCALIAGSCPSARGRGGGGLSSGRVGRIRHPTLIALHTHTLCCEASLALGIFQHLQRQKQQHVNSHWREIELLLQPNIRSQDSPDQSQIHC